MDSTKVIATQLKESKFYSQVNAVLTDGVAVGGFNIIDLTKLANILHRSNAQASQYGGYRQSPAELPRFPSAKTNPAKGWADLQCQPLPFLSAGMQT
ncbi:DUF99 family protein [Microbulbifer sp. OS29]|uniref:DUF99 family protein n=1 Tax=Microbulbifer okhotskensis TaxID=2926617 RepID=A0A9X2ENX3_9GAMM|nr:DUF99 family protein [Microbulbifer okhotskensis]MCO1335156.1 DUF99 family protein [Microbulbifer okhotskensis]